MTTETKGGVPRRLTSGQTYYSPEFKGVAANYGWVARADIADGFVGITQFEDGALKDRVLLSPAQWRQIVAFVEAHNAR